MTKIGDDRSSKRPRSAAGGDDRDPTAHDAAGPPSGSGEHTGHARAAARRVVGMPLAAAGKVAAVPRTAAGRVTRPTHALAERIEGQVRHAIHREPDPLAEHAIEHAGGADALTGPSPFVGFGLGDVVSGLRLAGTQVARQPAPIVRSLPGAAREAVRILAGRSSLAPEKGDRRFRDPAWERALFRRLVQIYVGLGSSVDGLVENSQLEGEAAERARFALGLIRDALAPSNGLLTNPEALRRLAETRGRSVRHGLHNWASDLVRNRGMPTQVDREPFAVGENLAITPGTVVHRTPVFELIQYTPQTDQVYERPLLVIPPQVNKYYAMDLRPGRSMYEYLVQQGIQLFGISWFNPTPDQRDWGFETYIEALLEATDAVRSISGADDVNAMGGCAGGIMLTLLAAYLEGKGERRLNSATTLVTLLDTHTDAQMLLFATPKTISAAKRVSEKKGVLDGRRMAQVFAWLRPNDLIWNYWVSSYLLGNDPPAFDILAWNADTTRLPARFHHELLDFVMRNQLAHPGDLEILGVTIDVSTISCDSYHVAGMNDHITPWEGCYRNTQMFGGDGRFVLCSSGHIQTLVASLDNRKLGYYVNEETPPDPEAWLKGADFHQGSWWVHWAGWLGERSGELVDAPSVPGDEDHPPLGPAPGQYVRH